MELISSHLQQVSNQLNRLYLKFLKRNPGYDGKVSVYGHSLGSVLSYDILCHQDILSSPFPMDWMYKEHSRNEKISPNINSQSSGCNFTSYSGDKSFVENTENKSMVGSVDRDHMSAQPNFSVLMDENTENLRIPMGPPVSSDSDEPSAEAMEPKQPTGVSLLDEDVHEPVSEESDMLSHEMDDLRELTNTNSESLLGDSKKIAEDVSESNKDKTIKSLREEIDFLKARITESESQFGGKGNAEETTTLTNQPVCKRLPPGEIDKPKSYTPYIKYTKLEFKVDTFFCVGSPLGVFLALRNVRIGIGKGQEYWEEENINEEMPACRQMFNIFHPFDPVAYRIEPLVCKEYINRRPVIIPYHKGGKRLHIGLQEFTEELASCSQAIMDHICSVRVKVLTLCQSRNKDNLDEASENAQQKEERSYGSIMMERLSGSEDGRIDHVLQDKTFQHPYISAIGAHTNYWRDFDTALFILKHLYRDIPEEPDSPDAPKEGSSNNERCSEGWSDQRDVAEEELPLTFADTTLIRNFSRKAKKIMKH